MSLAGLVSYYEVSQKSFGKHLLYGKNRCCKIEGFSDYDHVVSQYNSKSTSGYYTLVEATVLHG